MNPDKIKILTKYRIQITVLVLTALITLGAVPAFALPPAHYAADSRLAEGKWRRITVSSDGIYFISNAQLKTMGFNDPAAVNVFGYGGRMLSETLNTENPDDLPVQPVIRTDSGILFYGVGTVRWGAGDSKFLFSHSQNLYGTESYYFVSDRPVESHEQLSIDATALSGTDISDFTEALLHEVDMENPANTGANFFGEDFRTTPTRPFKFSLPDKEGDKVDMRVCFGAKATNGISRLSFTANGNTLEASSSDEIMGIPTSDIYCRETVTDKEISIPDNDLNLTISYSNSGVVYFARLNYIRINYTRRLSLNNGPLVFNLSHQDNVIVNIAGADSSTKIWDVTNPAEPIDIKYSLDGTTARFTPRRTGYRRYVAFNPGKGGVAINGSVAVNQQNIHGMAVPDMVIVTPAEFREEALRLASFHSEHDGMIVHVLTPAEIYNEFSSGTSDLTAIRKMFKMFYDRGQQDGHSMRYAIMFGKPTYDNRGISEAARNAGYPRLPIWQHPTGLSESTSICTDDYLGFLGDNYDSAKMGAEKLSIGVGRMPVKTLTEARQAVDKVITYSTADDPGTWRNHILIIADDQDNGEHLRQAESVYAGLTSGNKGKGYMYERLYLDTYKLNFGGTGSTYPEATARMLQLYNEGVVFVDYIGHGSTTSWGHEQLWTYTDILAMKNKRWPFYLTATCDFGFWDDFNVCAAEELWLNPKGGGIAFLTSARKAYITPNGILNRKIADNFFPASADLLPRRLGDIVRDGKNSVTGTDDNKLRFVLMGDPAVRLPIPLYNVITETVNGVDVTDSSGQMPELKAYGKGIFKGRITDSQGNTVTDFNGTLIPTLYDAERVIETNGNGEDGSVEMYNDRKNVLFRGTVEVKNGEWETTFTIPSEIENNYSPAQIVLYAYSSDGREANGSNSRFYVYGVDADADGDNEGPEISRLVLNSDAFKEGDAVNPAPLVIADVSDPSGINISQAGVGHQMTIVVDGRKVYSDIANSFTVSTEDSGSGIIRYQLPELEGGDHELTLTVWDNVGNSSSRTIAFKVSENAVPVLFDVIPDANPATTSVTFTLLHESPGGEVTSKLEVFTLDGLKIWSSDAHEGVGSSITWDLTAQGGGRVPRGIYLYRATITSPEGVQSTKTKKIAVAAK